MARKPKVQPGSTPPADTSENEERSWQISMFADRPIIEAALIAHEDAWDWDYELILSGGEITEDKPDDWRMDVFLPRKPTDADREAIRALFAGGVPAFHEEQLPEVDWITQSQEGLEPIHAGRFIVHTPDHEVKAEAGMHAFTIPASRAFGTGHHATTAGCLEMLTLMRGEGMIVRNLADIGTGTGLLAFAGLHLWPRALATASDIDAACVGVVDYNAQINHVTLGAGAGELTMLVADGMDDPVLQARGPYDLLIANILAGPLIELAPHFARALVPGGSLLLAGLLATQEDQVRAACRRAGLRLARRKVHGDWSVLWLRKRPGVAVRASRPGVLPDWARVWQ
ncbi:MAG: 50S ribosomal protein L11 methyltransferase [Sphingomonadales bacterium]|nr:50S ribosomal protein L11 methyltransferase [Sphingomonadales bacterium]MDE2168047.1 50S ribosomal protein L11 methyltransferase [Sphingomonadales bacterium]